MALYDTVEETIYRLRQCVVLYKGDPWFVTDVTAKTRIPIVCLLRLPLASFADNTQPIQVPINDPDLDYNYRNFRLGFYNSKQYGATYLYRSPIRHRQQGLSQTSVSASMTVPRSDRSPHFDFNADCLYDDAFIQLTKKRYPSFEEVVKSLDPKKNFFALAFSPLLAVRTDKMETLHILYKNERVAVNVEGTRFRLPKSYRHLKEVLAEAGVPT